MHWKYFFKSVGKMPSTMGFGPPKFSLFKPNVPLPKQLHPLDNRYFKQAIKNQEYDGIPTVYLSPFSGKSASIGPELPPKTGEIQPPSATLMCQDADL